jgi:ankyrin repeat protein
MQAAFFFGLDADPPRHKIFDAVVEGDRAAVKELLGQDKRLVAKRDGDGATPLHLAAQGGSLEVLQLLIDNGAR